MNAGAVLAVLARASIEVALLVLLLVLVARLAPALSPRARAALWWLVGLRALVALAPVPRLPLPLTLAPSWLPVAGEPARAGDGLAGAAASGAALLASAPVGPGLVDRAAALLVVAWIAGIVVGLVILGARLARLGATWRAATPARDPRLVGVHRTRDRGSAPARLPEVRVHPAIDAPLAVGFLHAGVLLPEGFARLPDEELALVLAHEDAHIHRGDLVLAWIPALAELVFWFHPLVRRATREYLAAREEACDVEALARTGAPPHRYGALLVTLGTIRGTVPAAASCGSRDPRSLQRRIAMLSPSHAPRGRRIAGTVLALAFAACALSPVRLVSARATEGKAHSGSFAYLIQLAGAETTRGSVAEADFDRARGLKGADRDLVYFRIGDRAWTTDHAATIAQVRSALEPEDEFGLRSAPLDQARARMERDEARLETLWQRTANERERKELEALRRDLAVHRGGILELERETYAERERLHAESMRRIERIARATIDAGHARELP